MDVFDLFARLSLDSKGYEEELNNAEKNGNSFMSNLGSLASGTAKIVGGAITAGAAAAGKIVKDGVEAYAQYEQLVGGVQKLFGTGGQSLEDFATSQGKTVDEVKGQWESLNASQDAVLSNASQAYKTAGMSANEYMETVTGFSAALIGSLGGDTEAAAAKADMALRAMSDNANTFGTDMESISNAYAGFSKQNYTMLDNLKLGYGGTKQEMERLLADAEEYMATQGEMRDLSVDSYADIVDAIQAVQEKQGIAGTTAREAATTIEGSLTTTKAAWENLITGIGDENADLETLISDLVESAGMAFNNILPVAEQALTGIGTLVEELLPVIVDEIPTLINDVIPQLLDSGINMVQTLLDGIQQNLPAIITGATDIINMLLTTFIDMLPQIIEMGMQIILQLILGIADALPDLIPQIVEVVLTIVDTLIDNIDMLIDAAIAIIIALADGLIKSLPKLIEKAPVIIVKLVTAIVNNAPKLLQAAITLITTLASGIISNLPKLISQIPKIVTGIFNALKSGFSKVGDIGKNLITGLWNGINDKVSWITNKIQSFGSSVISSIKGIFGIKSPSRVMKWVGQMLDEGFGIGIEENAGDVIKQAEGMANDVLNTFDNLEASVNPFEVNSDAINAVQKAAISVDTSERDNIMGDIIDLLNSYLPKIGTGVTVLDTGVMVGQMAPAIDSALGKRYAQELRSV